MPSAERDSFDSAAELYSSARPGYPGELLDELFTLAGLGDGAEVLEIGPGTGQATRGLLDRGARVTAVELGENLSRVMRRNLAGRPLEVVTAAFEETTLGDGAFDAVCSFTAWHWLDPAVRSERAAAALRAGAVLATVTTAHTRGGSVELFEDAQRCEADWSGRPESPTQVPWLITADKVDDALDEVDQSPLFRPAVRRRFTQDIRYTASEYAAVLGTYSNNLVLPAARRGALLACVRDLIQQRYGGTITKRYLHELRVARKRDA